MRPSGLRTVGIPRETKAGEHRVALTPDGVHELVAHGARVLVERDAGADSSIRDADYSAAGAEVVASASAAWSSGATAVAYETVTDGAGTLPLLAPMSEVAGRLAPQIGARFLERQQGGRGVLMGGAPGVRPARVVVIGAGSVGWNAAWIAQGMEAEVLLLDRNLDRLRWVDQIHRGRIMTLPYVVELAARGVDGAVAADPGLAEGVNVRDGAVVNTVVAGALEAMPDR